MEKVKHGQSNKPSIFKSFVFVEIIKYLDTVEQVLLQGLNRYFYKNITSLGLIKFVNIETKYICVAKVAKNELFVLK